MSSCLCVMPRRGRRYDTELAMRRYGDSAAQSRPSPVCGRWTCESVSLRFLRAGSPGGALRVPCLMDVRRRSELCRSPKMDAALRRECPQIGDGRTGASSWRANCCARDRVTKTSPASDFVTIERYSFRREVTEYLFSIGDHVCPAEPVWRGRQ